MSKKEHDAAVAQLRQDLSTFDKPWFKSCSDLLDRKKLKGLRCLDLCCGNCEYSIILRDRYHMNVSCGDYIPFHLKQAEIEGFPTIEIDLDGDSQAVGEIAGKYSEKFDLVVNLAAIEHVFNSDNLIQFAHKVLKPGGLLVINTPNIGFLGYRIYSALSGNRPFGDGHHVRFWDFRFLRTNLFFNGFNVVEDLRFFHSLPEETIRRGLRGSKRMARFFSLGFHLCHFFQYLPLMKGLATDELTVLCHKEDVVPIGFNYIKLKRAIENKSNPDVRQHVLTRLNIAKERGWLKEHIYMTRLVEENT